MIAPTYLLTAYPELRGGFSSLMPYFFLKKSFAPKLASPQHMPVSTPVPEAVREGIAATAGELKPPGNG